MAKRPTVQEILAAVRAAGPARPESEPDSDAPVRPPAEESTGTDRSETTPETPTTFDVPDTPAPSVPPATSRPLTLQEKLAAARNRPAAAGQDAPNAAPPAAPEPPPTSGRPLSVKEKLAAARNRPAATGQSAAPTPEPAPNSSKVASERPVGSTPSGTKPAAPAPSGKAMSLQEKLAAARGRPATEATTPSPKAKVKSSAPDKVSTGIAEGDVGDSSPPRELSEAHDLAESLRRSVANPTASANRSTGFRNASGEVLGASSPVIGSTEQVQQDRRGVLAGLLGSVGIRWVLGGAALVGGIGTAGVLVARRFSSSAWGDASGMIEVGYLSEFGRDSVVGVREAAPMFWVVRSTAYDGLDTIYALQGNCSGSGGLTSWSPESRTFECPGQANRFAISGLSLEGPGRRALERYRVFLSDDGQVVVDPSRTFREELGQWTDPESFIRLLPEEASLR